MNFLIKIFIIIFIISTSAKADEASKWLAGEIDNILNAYKNTTISNIEKFDLIEETIDENFAGAGIAKFVAGKSWGTAKKDTKKEYVKLFKKHLALSIASMMQGYSNQKYSLVNSKFDEKNKVSLIDMEIKSDTSKVLVTWRVKKSKNRYFVIDLLIADISFVLTKRSEFNSMLKKVNNRLDNFIEVLRNQNELSYNRLMD